MEYLVAIVGWKMTLQNLTQIPESVLCNSPTRWVYFPSKTIPKIYIHLKMDLDLRGCFGSEKTCLITKEIWYV